MPRNAGASWFDLGDARTWSNAKGVHRIDEDGLHALPLFDLIVGQWAIRTLRTAEGLAEFDRVVIQDGSRSRSKDALRDRFPGRFKTVSPAAVELHATMELLEETASRTALTADTGADPTVLCATANDAI